MKKGVLIVLVLFLPSLVYVPPSSGLPAEDVQVVTDAQYFQTAIKMIQEAKTSIHVMMFEMVYYEEHANSPSNLLIRELIHAKKRGVKVDVLLEIREEEDRTSKNNRHSGKTLADGGVEVTYDPSFKTTHAKVLIVDGKLTLLGSTNWTYHALTSNHETSLLLRSKEVAKELIDYFTRVKGSGNRH